MFRVLVVSLVLAFAHAIPATAATGTVTGTVTRSATSTPVVDGYVYMCTSSYDCFSATTDASGVYTITADPGTYYLYTANGQGLVDEIYDNIRCVGLCSVYAAYTTGAPIVVTSGGALSGKNFALDVGGAFSGTIVNAATSAPVSGALVYVYTLDAGSLTYAAYGYTDAAGVYTAKGMPTGTYYAFTYNSSGLINEIYDNIQCPGSCSTSNLASVATPIAVTAGATAPNKNFALDVGGSISGTVHDSVTSAPLANVYVYTTMLTASGGSVNAGYGYTNAAGEYTVMGLPSGTYYAYTWNSGGYINEVYDNLACTSSCSNLAAGTPISVTAGSTTTGRNFSLDLGGTISGTITNASTSAPLSGVSVYVYTRSSTGASVYAGAAYTNATGVYSFGGLPTGTYYAYTYNTTGFINEIYDNMPCLGQCSNVTAVERGTAIAVTAGATTSDKNFALDPGGTISGTVKSSAGSTPINNGVVYVYSKDATGTLVYVGAAYTNALGEYSYSSLPSGTYFLYTDSTKHLNEIYDGIACLITCNASTAASAGTPISVTVGTTTGGIDFVLDPGASISGTVKNAATSAPLSGVYVYAYRNVGDDYPNYVGYGVTNASGVYTVGGLIPGDYVLYTSTSGYQNQIYLGLNCPKTCSADLADEHGTLVPVTAGATTTGRDFSLSTVTGRITGTITNSATSAPVSGVYVYFYTRIGTEFAYAGYAYTNASGAYELKDLPSGTYYAVTYSSGKYVDEIYENVPCLTTCDYGLGAVITGTPIVVGTGSTTADFGLQPAPTAIAPGPPYGLRATIASGTVVFTWNPPYMFGKADDYVLEVGLSPLTTLVSIPVATTTYTRTGVPPGRYFARVRGRNSTGVGIPSSEIEFTVNADGSGMPAAPNNLAVWVNGGKVHVTWGAPTSSGGAVADYVLEIGSASGATFASRVVGPRTLFDYEPVPPPGVYFLRVRARNASSIGPASGEVMLVVGGAAAPPTAPGNLAMAVDTARRVAIGWTAPRGSVTGYVLEVGTASGRYDLGAFLLPAAPTFVTTASVPPGVYYFRLRAVNAMGVGVASYEETIIVQ